MDVRIDVSGLDQLTESLAAAPAAITRARKRALRQLASYVQRVAGKAAATATGMPQSKFKKLMRFDVRLLGDQGDSGLKLWVGTNPIKAHQLGTVKWTRRMAGARVGRRSFAGTWSWQGGQRTAGLVMQRTGQFGRNGNPKLERIDVVRVPVHAEVLNAIETSQPDIMAKYETLLRKELNYALFIEQQRRSTNP